MDGSGGFPCPFWADVLVCVGDQEKSEKTEVGACRRAVDVGRYTLANSVTRGNPTNE